MFYSIIPVAYIFGLTISIHIPSGLRIYLKIFFSSAERTDEEFECEILCSEVEHVKFFAGQPQPVLFLFLSQECGEKVRSICHMEPGDEEYFDPCCTGRVVQFSFFGLSLILYCEVEMRI